MKKRVIAVVVALALAISMSLALVGCNGTPSAFVRVDNGGKQTSNGVDKTNYLVIIKSGTDWANMTDADHKKITDYGVEQARDKAKTDGVTNFNILGKSEDGPTLFLYDATNDKVIIYNGAADNNQQISTIDAPPAS